MGDERLDVLGADGQPTGTVKRRAQVHHDGDWHRSFHLWIVREGRTVLMQRRAGTKDLEPGKLDVTVGGHFAAGETLTEVVREAEEELGVVVRPRELYYLGTRRVERVYPTARDREFQETYVLRRDAPLTSYAPHPGEVEVLYELPLVRAVALHRTGEPVAAAGLDGYGRQNDALLVAADVIEQAREDTVRTLESIQAWLQGL